jgi:hypothetical protein
MIAERFEGLALEPGIENIPDNLRRCYEDLAKMGLVEARELAMLEAWLADIAEVENSQSRGTQVVKC